MKNIGLQISEEEYEKLSTLADNYGLSRSLFLRRKLQEILSSSGPFVEGMKLLEELRKTANVLKDLEEKGGEEEDPARLLYHEHYCQLLKLVTEIKALLQKPAIPEEG